MTKYLQLLSGFGVMTINFLIATRVVNYENKLNLTNQCGGKTLNKIEKYLHMDY